MLTAALPIVANLTCSKLEDCLYEFSIDSDENLHHCKKTAGSVIYAGSTLSMLESLMHIVKSPSVQNPHTVPKCNSGNVWTPIPTVSVSKHVY